MSKGYPSQPKYELPEKIKEKVRKLIKDFMQAENINAGQLAIKLSEVYENRSASRTNILNKLARASFSLAEFIQILEAYGYVIAIKKTDGTTVCDKTS